MDNDISHCIGFGLVNDGDVMSRNPFRAIENDDQAVQAAKAGTITAGWIAAGCLLAIVAMLIGGRAGMLADAALVFGIICLLILSGLVAGIGWLIWTKQPLWASIAVLAGLVIQYSYAVASGGVGIPALILTFVALGCGILSVRGAWYHQQFLDLQRGQETTGA